jgi:hypothetical protein
MTENDDDKRERGRPPYEPTDKDRGLVSQLSPLLPQDDIAKILGIDAKTLRKHYREILDTALSKANAKVANALYLNATAKDNLGAQIFWLKTRAGWKETPQQIEFPGADGKPQAIPTMADFAKTMAAINGKGNQAQDGEDD